MPDVYLFDSASDVACQQWDAFIAGCPMSTFLHTRRFLSYHKERFIDQSLIFSDAHGRWLAVMPAAVNPNDAAEVISHPGITYSGIVYPQACSTTTVVACLRAAAGYYRGAGYQRLLYRCVPPIFHTCVRSDDVFALHSLGAKLYRTDLSCATYLVDNDAIISHSEEAMHTITSRPLVTAAWEVIDALLRGKYGVSPVHSADELCHLAALFPDQIRFYAWMPDDENIAAIIVIFVLNGVYHCQYIAGNFPHDHSRTVPRLMRSIAYRARHEGARYLSYGASTDKEEILNSNLMRFKMKCIKKNTVAFTYQCYCLPLDIRI